MATQRTGDRELPQPKASGLFRLSVATKKKIALLGVGAMIGEGVTAAIWATAKVTAYLISADIPFTVLGSAALGVMAVEGLPLLRRHQGADRQTPNQSPEGPPAAGAAKVNLKTLGRAALIGEGVTGAIWAGAKLTAALISTNVVGAVVGSALLGVAGAVALSDYRDKKAEERRAAREKQPADRVAQRNDKARSVGP